MDTHTQKSTSTYTKLPQHTQIPIKYTSSPPAPDTEPDAITLTTKNQSETETEAKAAAAETLKGIATNTTNSAVRMQAQARNSVVKKDGAVKAWISDKVENVLLAGPGWKIG